VSADGSSRGPLGGKSARNLSLGRRLGGHVVMRGLRSRIQGDEVTRGQSLMFLHAQTSGEMAYALAYVHDIGDIVKIEP